MYVLTEEQRAQILELQAEGATTREIAAKVGVSRETVTGYGMGAYRRKVLGLLAAIFTELETQHGIDPMTVDALLYADGLLGFSCPLHPEANPEEDFNEERECRLCRSDGLKRHHERRKQEGRPIVPPWRARKPDLPRRDRMARRGRGVRGRASEDEARLRVVAGDDGQEAAVSCRAWGDAD
jgi:AcrR family transcriptional regulator